MDQEEEEIDRQRAAGRPDSELLVGFGGGSGSPVSEPVVGPSGGSGSGSPISVSEPVQSWVMQQSAQELAACLGAEPCLEGNQTWTQYSRRGLINVLYNLNMMSQHLDSKAKKLDESIEEMLIRLDEFCAMLEMIRSDSSQILDENVPKLKAKALEMKKVYAKIDKMETFVKMVGQNAATLEQQVIQAEKDCGNLPHGVRRLLLSISAPSNLNKKCSCPKQQNTRYELPSLYRTEAYFPESSDRPYFSKPKT